MTDGDDHGDDYDEDDYHGDQQQFANLVQVDKLLLITMVMAVMMTMVMTMLMMMVVMIVSEP